jgi:protein SEY1
MVCLLTWDPVLRNPVLFVLILLMGGGTYVAYTLNLLGPMMQMTNAASNQAVEIAKEKLRNFLESNETVRQAIAMPARQQGSTGINMDRLDSRGKKAQVEEDLDDI